MRMGIFNMNNFLRRARKSEILMKMMTTSAESICKRRMFQGCKALKNTYFLSNICTAWYHPIPRLGAPHPTNTTSAWLVAAAALGAVAELIDSALGVVLRSADRWFTTKRFLLVVGTMARDKNAVVDRVAVNIIKLDDSNRRKKRFCCCGCGTEIVIFIWLE